MDISSRNVNPPAGPSGQHLAPSGSAGKRNRSDDGKWGRIGVVAAVAAVVILLVAVIVLSLVGNNDTQKESSYVDSSKLQAVFLNTGQVYFGNVTKLNNSYMILTNIYYLQTTNGANNSTNVTLVKLGCELHQPDDQMIINQEQVTFWENLHDSGQVAKAVADFKKNNPQGQKCVDQSTSSSTNSTNATQNASSNSGGTPSSTNSSSQNSNNQ